jgi:inner membrane protein
MFIAHLPAGYLLTSAIEARMGRRSRAVMATGLVASVLPDLDLLWFYLVDARARPHHEYLFHAPLFWVVLALLAWGAARLLHWRDVPLLVGVALANLLLHMLLDTVAGGIRWLWPFSDASLVLAHVPAGRSWWVWNFVLHWTFLLEVLICAAAFVVLVRRSAPRLRT